MYEAESRRDKQNHLRRYWHCKCDCGNEKDVSQHMLAQGQSLSCGCYAKERLVAGALKAAANKRKTNIFQIVDDYCVVKDNLNREFYIDIDDIEFVRQRYWYVRKSDGYVYSHNWDSESKKDRKIALHVYLTGEKYVDHKDHNPSNNRRNNLRVPDKENRITTNQGYNNVNHRRRSDNTSGYTGVTWDKKRNKWQAYIMYNYRHYYIGHYEKLEDAAAARKAKEIECFGEFAYQET